MEKVSSTMAEEVAQAAIAVEQQKGHTARALSPAERALATSPADAAQVQVFLPLHSIPADTWSGSRLDDPS